jgi:hypothetical protein
MYPTQAKKRLEWATVGFVAALEWVFAARLSSPDQTKFPARRAAFLEPLLCDRYGEVLGMAGTIFVFLKRYYSSAS